MATEKQLNDFQKKLKKFIKENLQEKFMNLKEADTRLIVNKLLCDVFEYIEFEDIKTEYRIKSEYADYVIQLNKKLRIVVEVKAIETDINERHLKQSFTYAVNEGIEWIMLTNGRQVAIYRVIFGKPPQHSLLFEYSLLPLEAPFKEVSYSLYHISKKSFKKNEIEALWKANQTLSPEGLYKHLFSTEIMNCLRRQIKKDVGINFNIKDIQDSLLTLVNTENSFKMPKIN